MTVNKTPYPSPLSPCHSTISPYCILETRVQILTACCCSALSVVYLNQDLSVNQMQEDLIILFITDSKASMVSPEPGTGFEIKGKVGNALLTSINEESG